MGLRATLDRLIIHPPSGPRRAGHMIADQPHWTDPEPPADLALWAIAQLGIEQSPASETLANYWAAFFELSPDMQPQWNEAGTRIGLEKGSGNKAVHFQLGRIPDPHFWRRTIPGAAEEVQLVSSSAALFVRSRHSTYGGSFRIGTRHNRNIPGEHRLLICHSRDERRWQHHHRFLSARDDSLVLALGRGVLDRSMRLHTRKADSSTSQTTPGYVGPNGHRFIPPTYCKHCAARPYTAIGAAGCAYPIDQITGY